MAQIKISELPAAGAANDAMQLEVNDAGTSKRLTIAQVYSWLGALLFSDKATDAEMEAGLLDNKWASPQGVAAAIAAQGLGVGQTWQDVTASRAWGVNYQNTTGKPIQIIVRPTSSDTTKTLQVGVSTGSYLTVAADDDFDILSAIVPDQHYYRATGSGTLQWTELR